MLRRAVACGLAACAVVACFPQGACLSDPPVVEYCQAGDATCQGSITDATHWESGPISGTWLTFSRERTINMHFRDAKTGATLSGEVVSTEVYINVASTLAQSPYQYVPCAGNNCEILPFSDGTGASVKNDTCGDYFVRAYVTVVPTTQADASTE